MVKSLWSLAVLSAIRLNHVVPDEIAQISHLIWNNSVCKIFELESRNVRFEGVVVCSEITLNCK